MATEAESNLSDAVIKVERERSFDLTKSQDAAAEYRTLTEAEFTRNRLRLVLPQLQHKLQTACAQEQMANWSIEYDRVEAIRDQAAYSRSQPQLSKVTSIPNMNTAN
jgi:hypothetical protein